MLTISLIGIFIGILVQTGLRIRQHRQYVQKYNELAERLGDFMRPSTPDDPSDFNKVLDQIAVLFADRYRIALSAADRGAQGAAARDINRGLEEIAAEQSPALAVAQNLPRSLRKNPLAAAGLNMLIQNILSKPGSLPGQGSPGSPGNNGSQQAKFSL